jgi:uncharacterized protein (TIGR03437 family)
MGSLFAFLLLAAAWPTIRWEPWITTGLEAPVDLQSPRDGSGRLFVVEQRGRIRLIRNGALVTTPVLDIVSKVQYRGEMGLLGLAFPPGFQQKQYFYVNYVDRERRTIVARYKISGDTADVASEEVLLTIAQPYENHNGGCLQFSPRDGQLYIGMGDGGSGGDPQKFSQNPNSQLGKMLRMDVENGARTAQIWASGLRNPWRFSFDRATADMYIADVGQGALEEIDFQPADAGPGVNYGWSLMEGTRCFDDRNCASRTDLVRPIFEYGRTDGISVTGGYVYRGARFPFLAGIYLFGDFGSGQIWGTRRNGANWETEKLDKPGLPIASFGEDEAGEQYLISLSGGILRLAADPPPAAVNAVVSAASFAPGLAPGGIATAFLNAVNGVSGVVAAVSLPLPTTLSGLGVQVNGEAAPLFAVANSGVGAQVNFLIPATIATGPATFSINGVEARATIAEAAPAVFTVDGRLAAVQGPGTAGQPIEIYATGLGTRINSIEVLIGGRTATVQFAGAAPGFVGLNQINAVVPAGTPAGEAELVIRIGSVTSPTVRLPVR